jgi:hypothetical protein
MKWVGHVAHRGGMRNACKIVVGKPEGKRPLRRHSIDGMVILGWILGKWGKEVWTGCILLRIGTTGSFLGTQ